MFNFIWFVGSNCFPTIIPWFLRMSCPGENITRKTIQMQKKMKELDKKEIASKSLLANVLDMDDDFHPSTMPNSVYPYHPSHAKPALTNVCLTRYITFSKIIENYKL